MHLACTLFSACTLLKMPDMPSALCLGPSGPRQLLLPWNWTRIWAASCGPRMKQCLHVSFRISINKLSVYFQSLGQLFITKTTRRWSTAISSISHLRYSGNHSATSSGGIGGSTPILSLLWHSLLCFLMEMQGTYRYYIDYVYTYATVQSRVLKGNCSQFFF